MSHTTILPTEQGASAHLHCCSGDIPALIQVLDAMRQPVSESIIGCLHITLPLGRYHVQFILGDELKEYSISLDQAGSNNTVRNNSSWYLTGLIPSEEEISFTGQNLQTLIQYQEAEHIIHPRGQLVLILQQMNLHPPYYHQEIRLEQADHTLVTSFQPDTENSEVPLFIYEWRGEADTWLLSLPGSGCKGENLAITLCAGWQTQIVLHVDEGNHINLQDASLAMTQLGKAFQRGDHILSLTESLRILLLKSMKKPLQVSQEGLWSHFSNPIVGLFSTWLLLQSPDKNRALLTKMIVRLKQLIGWTPDVRALAWAILLDEPPQLKLKGWRKELRNLPPLDRLPTLQKSGAALLQAQQQYQNVIISSVQAELLLLVQNPPQEFLLVQKPLL